MGKNDDGGGICSCGGYVSGVTTVTVACTGSNVSCVLGGGGAGVVEVEGRG